MRARGKHSITRRYNYGAAPQSRPALPWAYALAVLLLAALAWYGLWGPEGGHVVNQAFAAQAVAYTGQLSGGKFTGGGTLAFENGDVYEGGFSGGRFQGYGVFQSADGWRYEGLFQEGTITGEGTLYGQQGDVLQGDPAQSIQYVSAENWRYEGGIDQLGQSGLGTFTYPDGSVYEGGFRVGLAHGEGVYTDASGRVVYQGGFASGLFEGQGVYHSPEGWRYEGGFAGGLFHGEGTLVEQDGQSSSGVWDKGVKIS